MGEDPRRGHALQALVASEAELLIHRFHSTRKLTETIAGDMLPFILSEAMRGSKAQQAHDAFNLLAGNAAFRLVGSVARGCIYSPWRSTLPKWRPHSAAEGCGHTRNSVHYT